MQPIIFLAVIVPESFATPFSSWPAGKSLIQRSVSFLYFISTFLNEKSNIFQYSKKKKIIRGGRLENYSVFRLVVSLCAYLILQFIFPDDLHLVVMTRQSSLPNAAVQAV